MKKEILLAIIVGLSIGLFITFGVYQARVSTNKRKSDQEIAAKLTPSAGEEFNGELMLNTPKDEIIQTEKTTTVSGVTWANSFVVVLVKNDETIITSDGSGNFTTEVNLEDGSNLITVIALDEDGHNLSEERTIIVSDVSLDNTPEATDSAEENTEAIN